MVIRAYFIDSPDFMNRFHSFPVHPECTYIIPLINNYSKSIEIIEEANNSNDRVIIVFDNPIYLDILKKYVRETELYIDNYKLFDFNVSFKENLCHLYTIGHFALPNKSHSWTEYIQNHSESQIVIPGNANTYPEFNTLAQLLLIHKEWTKDTKFSDGYYTIYRSRQHSDKPFYINHMIQPYRLFHFPSSVMAEEFIKTFENELLTIRRFV